MIQAKCCTPRDRSLEVRRVRRRNRSLIFLATAIAGLAFTGPALADDGPEPPALPEMPEPAALPAVPTLDELPVVVTEIDGGNVDVSIEVFSSGADETAAEEVADSVVSPAERA